MPHRSARLIGCFVAATAVAWIAADRPAAQGPPRPAKPSGIPRTADGRPDLQGTFNVATITPVDRPAEFGNRLTLTEAEAKAMEQYEVQRNEKDRAPSAADRTAPPVTVSSVFAIKILLSPARLRDKASQLITR